jgi:hypothetical protein
MADFSLTTLFVMPSSQAGLLPNGTGTTDLAAGQVGIFNPSYVATNAPASSLEYIYIAQGRENTYLQGTKRSDKIGNCCGKIIDWYKTSGCPTPINQVTEVGQWNVKCGDVVTVTLRGHSSYIDTLYFNGYTRSITVQAPCCDCGADPCTNVDVPALIDQLIAAFEASAPGINPDNVSFNTFYTFSRVGNDANAVLRIEGKPLTKYGQPCDVAAFPYEYDRLWFRTFVYTGPATTADFIVADACNIIATPVIVQDSNFASGTPAEIQQLEKDYYSYQAGYLKHLYRMGGYNYNFESYVDTTVGSYDTYYIKYKPAKEQYTWGDYIYEDAMVIIAVPSGDAGALETALETYLGDVTDYSAVCETTTTTTSTTAAPII